MKKLTDLVGNKTYKDLCIILDTSMSLNPFYESMIIGADSAFRVGIGDKEDRRYALLTFSKTTKSSGWIPKHRIDEFEEIYNLPPDATELDPKSLKEIIKKGKNYAALMVTDGYISNSKEVMPLLKKIVKKGNRLGTIFIGHISNEMEELKDFADVYEITAQGRKDIDREIVSKMDRYSRFVLKGEKKPEY